MKIKSIKSIGTQSVYSPEMKSEQHNYLTQNSDAVHKNSHAIAYAAVIAYRCSWLKAHFFPEWMASVLTDCANDKVPRYISMARSENWKPTDITNLGKIGDERFNEFDIIALNVNSLTPDFSVISNVLTVGLLQVKGLGEADRPICDIQGPFGSLDDFITKTGAGKKVCERLIKLGAFSSIYKDFVTRKSLWQYYGYQYKKFDSKTRTAMLADIWEHEGWNEQTIEKERQRQSESYFEMYPNRKKIPTKILKWKPKPSITIDLFVEMNAKEFRISEIIEFEKDYLGYNLSNPMSMYITNSNRSIAGAIECDLQGLPCVLDVIILSVHHSVTAKNTPYVRIEVTDGLATTAVFIWSNNLENLNKALLKKDQAVSIPVGYQPSRKSFSILKNKIITPLISKEEPELEPKLSVPPVPPPEKILA